MEGRVSNYATAYKYKGAASSLDKNRRLQRRSIEQKDSRHELINKRRNIIDLSPVNEGNSTLKDRSKDTTPVKPRDEKGFKRLEMLKQWRAERDLKKKESEAKKKEPFRMKKMSYKEGGVYYKEGVANKNPVKSHAVKPQTTQPVIKQQQKAVVPSKNRSIQIKKPQVTTVVPKAYEKETLASRGRMPVIPKKVKNAAGGQIKTHGKEETLKQQKNVSQPTTRNTRLSKPVSSEVDKPVRSKRQTITKKVVQEPEVKESKSETDLNNITTQRGCVSDTTASESFAPASFTFTSASFVFNPLSPNSAANFLFPGQDTSCSFLDHNPKISSTPKGGKRKSRKSTDESVCENTVSESPKSTKRKKNTKEIDTDNDDTVMMENEQTVICERNEAEAIEQHSSTVVHNGEVDESNETLSQKNESFIEKKQTVVRRGSRRSVLSAAAEVHEQLKEAECSVICADTEDKTLPKKNDSPVKKPQTPLRRSSRRSVLSSTTVQVNSEEENEKVTSMSESRKSRKSINVSVMTEENVEVLNSPKKVSRKSVSNELEQDELTGSTKKVKRNTRKSVIRPVEKESIPETVHEEIVGEDSVFVSNDSVKQDSEIRPVSIQHDNTIEAGSNKQSADNDNLENPEKAVSRKKVFLSDSAIANKTPGRRGSRSKNKSFGGFKLPDSECAALSASAKRKHRKSVMPKSPEEWVDLFSKSPMIEMNRRTPKGTPSTSGLNFEDFDALLKEKETDQTAMETASLMPTNPKMNLFQALEDCESSVTSKEETVSKTDVQTEESTEPLQTGNTEEKTPSDAEMIDEVDTNAVHDVNYFRQLLVTESARLKVLCAHWEDVNTSNTLTEEISGQIRTTVGQAVLLMNQRFKQFTGLVDNCEFKTGEKETTCTDLDGFWEMVYIQVKDVDTKFDTLTKLQANNWVDDAPKPVVKKIKKKVTKPSGAKKTVASKFAAFREKMKKKQVSQSPEKVFEAGFFVVASPVRSPAFHCEAGTPKKTEKSTADKANTQEEPPKTDTLSLPSSSELLMKRTPCRKSYAPAIPSPLLVDSTPQPRPSRSCTKKTPLPRQLLNEDPFGSCEKDEKSVKKTPRRSIRARKSVNFADSEPPSSPANLSSAENTADITTQPEIDIANISEENFVDDSVFAKFLQPMSVLYSTSEKENSPRPAKRRRSSSSGLKSCPSDVKRRSISKKVHFNSTEDENSPAFKLPKTPYSNTTEKRVTRRSLQSAENQNVLHFDSLENSPQRKTRSPRPSLLYTPPDFPRRGPAVPLKEVPTAVLISFTP